MADIALPTRGIRSIEWTQPPRSAWASKSGYSGKATIIDRGTVSEGWRAKMVVAPRSAADVLAWRAWQALMRGQVNTTLVTAVEAPQVASGALFTIGSNANPNAITLSGLPASQTNYIKAGQLLTIYTGTGPDKPRLFTATGNMSTDGGGVSTTLTFEPPVPASVVSRVAFFRLPFCQMRLVAGSVLGWSVSPGAIYEPTALEFEEVIS